MPGSLSPDARAAALRELGRETLDLLVVGGGITGAGIARDAALRGLRTGLVEAVDFAAGTSSRSSKLVHGGVRYLQQGDVALVREAATERAVLRRIAPHLAEPLLMVLPTYRLATHLKLRAGLFMFEKIADVEPGDRHLIWGRDEALAGEPLLAPAGLHGAAAFTEYLTDDARLVLANVQAAHAAGALVANHAEVTALGRGRATVRDALDGATYEVSARTIVNAGGPWVDEIRRRGDAAGGTRLQLTKGIHLVVPHARLPVRQAVVMTARDKRSVFVVPRDGVTYIGTTDTFHPAPELVPAVTREDADYLLEATNRTFRTPLSLSDVTGTWSGLRPLLAEEGKAPSEISRKDEIIVDDASGLVSIAGGKLTAYRRMAERIVDLVVARLGRPAAPCTTGDVALTGGEAPPPPLPAALDPPAQSRLRRLYGAACGALLARDPSGACIPGLGGVLRAEIDHAIDAEMALTLEDVLERRTRALLFDARQGIDGVEEVATRMASRLGWTTERTERECDGYRRLAAELRSFA